MSSEALEFLRARVDEIANFGKWWEAIEADRPPYRPAADPGWRSTYSLDAESKLRILDFVEYLAQWHAGDMYGVSEHEIRMMHGAAKMLLGLLVLPYAGHPEFPKDVWKL